MCFLNIIEFKFDIFGPRANSLYTPSWLNVACRLQNFLNTFHRDLHYYSMLIYIINVNDKLTNDNKIKFGAC